MKKTKKLRATIGVLLAAAAPGCVERVIVGDADTENAPDAGTARGDGGLRATSDAGAPRLGGDGAAPVPPALTACPTGRLCWSNPLPAGDDFTSVYAAADDDVWLGTSTGAVLHYDGASFSVKLASPPNGTYGLVRGQGSKIWNVSSNNSTCLSTQLAGSNDGGTDLCYLADSDVGVHKLDQVRAATPVTHASVMVMASVSQICLPNFDSKGRLTLCQAFTAAAGDEIIDVAATSDANGITNVYVMSEQGHVSAWARAGQSDSSGITEIPTLGGSYLSGVGLAAISPNDVWAVESAGDTGYDTYFRHFDGASWTTTQASGAAGCWGGNTKGAPPSVQYGGRVVALASDDVWAVGGGPTCDGVSAIYHFDGAAWSRVPTTGDGPLGGYAYQSPYISVTATSLFAATTNGRLYKMDRATGTWTKLAGENPYDSVGSMSAPAHDDVWALMTRGPRVDGTTPEVPYDVLHFDGTAWSPVSTPSLSAPPNGPPGLFAFADGTVWFYANEQPSLGSVDVAEVFVRKAGTWEPRTAPGLAMVTNIWGSSPTDVWIAGTDTSYLARLWHWDGQSIETNGPSYATIWGLTGDGPSSVWFSAQPTPSSDDSILFHADGINHTATSCVAWGADGSPWFAANGQVFASNGNHWDGTSCTNIGATGTAIWGSSTDDVWLVGGNYFTNEPTLFHWDGSHVSTDTQRTAGPSLTAIAGSGKDDFWVGGRGGGLLRTSLDAPAGTMPSTK